jgi:hypothetical protein
MKPNSYSNTTLNDKIEKKKKKTNESIRLINQTHDPSYKIMIT